MIVLTSTLLIFGMTDIVQYGKLAELSLDIIAAPAPQAYVERNLSVN